MNLTNIVACSTIVVLTYIQCYNIILLYKLLYHFRLNSDGDEANNIVISIYKTLKSAKKQIDKFVKWYRRELERRNMI